MPADFTISVDVTRNLVHVTLKGFFAQPHIDAFRAERERAHQQLQCGRNQHVTLVDIRELGPQSQPSLEAFGEFLCDNGKRSLRLAFVTGPSLSKLQVRRAAGQRQVGYFTDLNQARIWLLEQQPTLTAKPGAPPGWSPNIFK